MSDAQLIIGTTLAAGGQRATALASVICTLVVEGGKLGELAEVPAIGIDGQPRTIKTMPQAWLQRLSVAIARGVFDHPNKSTVRKVVDRILTTAAE